MIKSESTPNNLLSKFLDDNLRNHQRFVKAKISTITFILVLSSSLTFATQVLIKV